MREQEEARETEAEVTMKTKQLICKNDLKPWAQPVGCEDPQPVRNGEVVEVDVDQAKTLVKSGLFSPYDPDLEG